MRRRGLALVVLLSVLGGVGSLFLEDIMLTRSEAPEEAPSDAPEFFFEDFTVHVMAPDGSPNYVLAGRELVRRPGTAASAIEAPRMEITPARQPRWDLSARRGWLYPDNELVELRGDVVLTRAPAPPEREPLRIETESLDLHTRERLAVTEADVAITATGWQVQSRGMSARFDRGLLELPAQVYGRYQPGSAP